MFVKFLCAWVLLYSAALGQVEVKSAVYYQISGVSDVQTFGDVVLSKESPSLSSKPVGVIRITSSGADIDVALTDVNRVSVEAKKLTDTAWLIDKPGKFWVEVREYGDIKLADGSNRRILLDSVVSVVEFKFEPGPDPGPDPGPGPTPPGPVPNEYGVGAVAYQYAPRDAVGAAKMAAIYKQSGEFLFGIPSLKFIVSNKEAHSKDPNRSILAWIDQQYATIQCPDQATCQQWTVWKQKVAEALVVSQSKRQFTRQDWFNAFNEIAKAVGTPK